MAWTKISQWARHLRTHTASFDNNTIRKTRTNKLHLLEGWAIPNMCWGKKLQLPPTLAFSSYISIIYTHCVGPDIQETHIANHPASFVEKCSPDKKIKKKVRPAPRWRKAWSSGMLCSSTAGDYGESLFSVPSCPVSPSILGIGRNRPWPTVGLFCGC